MEAGSIVKGRVLDCWPAVWFLTAIETGATLEISEAAMVAAAWLALEKVVGRGAPFHKITESSPKLLPATVSVKAGPPSATVLGAMLVSPGAVAAGSIVNGMVLDWWPLVGLRTPIEMGAALEISEAEMVAVTWLAFEKVVWRGAPFHKMTESGAKLLPATASVKAEPPSVTALGAILVMAGAATEGGVLGTAEAAESPTAHPDSATTTARHRITVSPGARLIAAPKGSGRDWAGDQSEPGADTSRKSVRVPAQDSRYVA